MRVFEHPVRVGWLATLAIFGLAVWVGFSEYCAGKECMTKFAVLARSRPNEVGDTLAGFAGALAFVWIIVTVWLQSKELAAQREELRMTRTEVEGQRKATQDMARAIEAQAAVFEDEKNLRIEESAARHLEQLLEKVRIELDEAAKEAVWVYNFKGYERSSIFTDKPPEFIEEERRISLFSIKRSGDETHFFRSIPIQVRECVDQLAKIEPEQVIFSPKRSVLFSLSTTLNQMLELRSKLANDQKERLSLLKIAELNGLISGALAREFWEMPSCTD